MIKTNLISMKKLTFRCTLIFTSTIESRQFSQQNFLLIQISQHPNIPTQTNFRTLWLTTCPKLRTKTKGYFEAQRRRLLSTPSIIRSHMLRIAMEIMGMHASGISNKILILGYFPVSRRSERVVNSQTMQDAVLLCGNDALERSWCLASFKFDFM